MKKISKIPVKMIRFVLADIDDTLSTDGKITARTYSNMWKLSELEIPLILVTGRPAGWCDFFARMWPVHGVIGENGAFYFRYIKDEKNMKRIFIQSEEIRKSNGKKLQNIKEEILKNIPNAGVSADQDFRISDLAIDFCEDVSPLSKSEIQKIKLYFEKHGAQAKISSIHVNGWLGDFNKVTTTWLYFKNEFQMKKEEVIEQAAFIGDSPNDAPLFEAFKYSIGVSNINKFAKECPVLPKYVTESESGQGFCEFVSELTKETSK